MSVYYACHYSITSNMVCLVADLVACAQHKGLRMAEPFGIKEASPNIICHIPKSSSQIYFRFLDQAVVDRQRSTQCHDPK